MRVIFSVLFLFSSSFSYLMAKDRTTIVDRVYKRQGSDNDFFVAYLRGEKTFTIVFGSLKDGLYSTEAKSTSRSHHNGLDYIDETFILPNDVEMRIHSSFKAIEDVDYNISNREGKMTITVGDQHLGLILDWPFTLELDAILNANTHKITNISTHQFENQIFNSQKMNGWQIGLPKQPQLLTMSDRVTILENGKTRSVGLSKIAKDQGRITLEFEDKSQIIGSSLSTAFATWTYKDPKTQSSYTLTPLVGYQITHQLLKGLNIPHSTDPYAPFSNLCFNLRQRLQKQ